MASYKYTKLTNLPF